MTAEDSSMYKSHSVSFKVKQSYINKWAQSTNYHISWQLLGLYITGLQNYFTVPSVHMWNTSDTHLCSFLLKSFTLHKWMVLSATTDHMQNSHPKLSKHLYKRNNCQHRKLSEVCINTLRQRHTVGLLSAVHKCTAIADAFLMLSIVG